MKALRGDGVAALAADTHIHLPCPPSTLLHSGTVSMHGATELCTRRGWIGAQLSKAGRLTCPRGARGDVPHAENTPRPSGTPYPPPTADNLSHVRRRARHTTPAYMATEDVDGPWGCGWDGALCGRGADGGAAATAWTRDGAEGRKRRRRGTEGRGSRERREGVHGTEEREARNGGDGCGRREGCVGTNGRQVRRSDRARRGASLTGRRPGQSPQRRDFEFIAHGRLGRVEGGHQTRACSHPSIHSLDVGFEGTPKRCSPGQAD